MLKEALRDVNARVAGYRASARTSIAGKAPGLGGVYHGVSDSSSSSMSDWQRAGKLTNQYRAALTGIPYTAIRPAATKLAGQPFRIGFQTPTTEDSDPQFRTKQLGAGLDASRLLSKNLRMMKYAPEWLKRHADNVEVAESHPFLDAMADPNPYMTQWAVMWCTVFSIYATGQALWLLDNEDGKLRIYYIPTTWAEPIHTPDLFAAWKIRPLNSSKDSPPIPAANVVHFMLPDPANPMIAHSPMMAHARAINTDDQIQLSQYASMKNGLRPGVILKAGRMPAAPGSTQGPMRPILTPDQRNQLITAIKLAYRGVEKSDEPIIVDGMIEDVVPFTNTPADMDYPQGSKMTEARIMKGIGTNPIVAGEIEGANRASAYVAHDGFYEINVNPLASFMSQTITRRIGPMYSNERKRVVAWIEEAKAYDKDLADGRMRSVLASGVVTRGELRRWCATGEIDLPAREDDDELVSVKQKPETQPPQEPDSSAQDANATGQGGQQPQNQNANNGNEGKPKQKPSKRRSRR
jgi:phage portal protein BeeE